ncbi:3-hydroxyacyl-CoA dehydrogenase family protein [Dietzia sp. UBA5065]|jgi:3-hydroxybutyryl-CoA dehydrogenase|uniref:3-hydroxyacyl-CoA dehydrogenase family protein n=1 Tax=Dietzia sp. UBA5065 TaxID=1946422 RepID=UPI0025B8969A|nr:3-hydroxyacyl-CoA dehydrogenase family protein [Dietzia sp. UBA5065]
MTVPERVGVYGGGRMGAGIAYAFLAAGSRVTVIEATGEAASAARARLAASVTTASERGHLDRDPAELLARVEVSDDPSALEGCELVVEAVPESPALKAGVLAAIEAAAPDAWIGTNTSSLSIDDLAGSLARPERLVGLHFFNPVPASALVEIVVGGKTDPALVERARTWVGGLGKTAVSVTDSPGFASSRLGVMLALEAMRMVEEGVASAGDVDTAMELGYRHPMGPLRTTDLVGLDVRLAIAEYLEERLGPRFAPPRILRDKVAAGDLGKKTGRGFFSW